MLRRLLLAGFTVVALGVAGCASAIQTRKEPDVVKGSIETVLQAQGFESISVAEEPQAWRVRGILRRTYPYLEKIYEVGQEPSLRIDPAGNNVTVFEEKIDPAKSTSRQMAQEMVFQADISLSKQGPDRRLTVSVQGPSAVKADKYRQISWLEGEPPSPLQIEETIVRSLKQAVAN